MSSEFWQVSLSQTLQRLQTPDRLPRIAIVGIGHELRGDDAAGVVLVRALRSRVAAHERLLVIDAGPVPENVSGSLRRFKPALVLLIDAAHMDAEPGSTRWLAWQAATGISASTHSLPIHVLAAYLEAELGCEVALLGIQPAHTSFGAPLSLAVEHSVKATAEALADILQDWKAGRPWVNRIPDKRRHNNYGI
jgi:hydrogenase 3 maturation protease